MIKISKFVLAIFWLLIPLTYVHATSPTPKTCGTPPVSGCPGREPATFATAQKVHALSVVNNANTITDVVTLLLLYFSGVRITHNLDIERTKGYSAGDNFSNWSGWVSYARTQTDNTSFFTQFDSSLNNALVGFDTSPRENMVAGIAFGYEDNDIDTVFNAGEQDIDGFTIAPYFGYLFHPNFSIDASAGYSSIDIDQFRIDSTNFTSIINGDTDSDRWFVAGNLNAFTRVNDFAFLGRVGIVYSEDDIDAVVETGGPDAFTTPSNTVEFGQIQAGGEVAYSVTALEPYASIYYEHDFEYEKLVLDPRIPRAKNDRNDVRLGLGARYFGENGFSANLEWSIIAGREEFDSHTLSIVGRLEF